MIDNGPPGPAVQPRTAARTGRFAIGWRAGVPLLAGLLPTLVPAPAGIAPHAWHYFALFVAVILALITEPIPSAAIGVIGVTVAATFRLPFTPAQLADPSFQWT